MFLPTSEQAPRGPRTLRLDLYSKRTYDKSCHTLYKLRIAPCFALSQSYRYSDFARSRFILIPVAFEIAYSLLRALRVRRSCLRFRRAYTVKKHVEFYVKLCIIVVVPLLCGHAGIAQQVEHFTRNEGVIGSNPTSGLIRRLIRAVLP